MRSRLLTAILLIASVVPAAAQVLPDRAPVCDAACLPVLRAGVAWLLESEAYAPADVALDTTSSGLMGAGPNQRRIVSSAILGRVAADVGVKQVAHERAMVCTEQGIKTTCRLQDTRILMVVYPPRLTDRDDAFRFQVMLIGNLHEDIPHGFRIFEITVQRIRGTWIATESRLVGMS